MNRERRDQMRTDLEASNGSAKPAFPARKVCEKTGKVCYSSKHDARRALVGGLSGKSIRAYPCGNHFHNTRDWLHKRNH